MRHCLSLKSPQPSSSSTTVSTILQGNSTEDTPRSNGEQLSPITTTVNLSREYTLAVQTNSYNEIFKRIQVTDHNDINAEESEEGNRIVLLSQVLHPDRQSVEESLRDAKSGNLTNIVTSYFDHSENTSHLCLFLNDRVHRAREQYAPILNLLDILPDDSQSFSQSQCDWAFDIFLQFDRLDNPFPSPDSNNFHDMRRCFSQLKQQLDRRLYKSKSRLRSLRRATASGAICLIGVTVVVALSAIAIAAHALITLVAGGALFTSGACLPRKFTKKELAHIAQLDAAAKGTYVLNNDIDTIDRLVARLYTAVENDKDLIRFGLERGKDKYSIQEVVKRLRKNHHNFLNHLQDLEEHICLCFTAVNRARSLLLQEICLHQTCNT